MEKNLYPSAVNMLFFVMIIINIYYTTLDLTMKNDHFTNLILETSISLFRYIWCWLGHLFIIKYFKKRNMEEMLDGIALGSGNRQTLGKVKRRLTLILISSIVIAVTTVVLSMVAGFYLHYPSKWKIDHHKRLVSNGTVYGTRMSGFVKTNIVLISISDFYLMLTALCLTWLMYLLYHTSDIRLLALKHDYARWNQHAEDAIFRHYIYYDLKVKSSCQNLQALFISHNILMVIITPQLFFLCVEIGKNQCALDVVVYVLFLLFMFICWFTPLYYAECMKMNEESFCNEINKFCPGYLAMYFEAENQQSPEMLTLRARREVNKLVSYLKARNSGFLIGGYSYHTQLSMLSFYLGLLTFIVKIMA